MADYNNICAYNVSLVRLTEDKIEMVRQKRNDPKISQYMEYREYITPEMQTAWFNRINNDNNFYFIINYDNKEIGLINIRDIDYNEKCGEPGIFIWDDEYLNSDVSFRAVCALSDFGFETLKLSKFVIHVLSDNKRAIKFNKAFGYKQANGQENIYNQQYTLEKEQYLLNKNRITKYL